MIDEIDYFPKRDKYKKKGAAPDSEWDALKKIKTGQDSGKVKSGKKGGKEAKPGKKKRAGTGAIVGSISPFRNFPENSVPLFQSKYRML